MATQRVQRARLEQASKLDARIMIIPFKATFPVIAVNISTRAD